MCQMIYAKRCLGQDGKIINIYKFRTMHPGAHERLEEVAVNGFDSLGKVKNDPRITPIGKFLRKYWIDELPQIYNLARGDIKLVGIRPMSESDWMKYPPVIMERSLRQKPGLIGFNYAFEPSDDFENKFEHIKIYLDQWERDPVATDQEFLLRVIENIVFRGVRSS